MLKEYQSAVRLALIVMDLVVVTAAFFLSYFFREHIVVWVNSFLPTGEGLSRPVELYLYIKPWLLGFVSWFLALEYFGLYTSFRTRSMLEQAWRLIKSAVVAFFLFGTFAFIFREHMVSRVFVGIFIIFAFFLLLAERIALIHMTRNLRRLGHNYRHVIVVGSGPRAGRLIKILQAHREWGVRVTGILDEDPERVGQDFYGVRCVGTVRDIESIITSQVVDEVLIAVPRSWLDRIQPLLSICEIHGIKVNLASDLFNLNLARAVSRDLDGVPLLTFETTVAREWELMIKRFLDMVLSFFGIIILSPVFLTTIVLIKLTSPGPVFFSQKRKGLNGREFHLHKFRSMYQDAQARLAELKHLNEMDGPVFKIKDDPRITPVGKWIRKFSIDELPQLYDVLIGNMSLVGPRPALPSEVDEYEPWQRRRLSMRPGITCLWQIMGRNTVSFQRWMELDLEYIDNWSLWLDFRILMMTVPAVILAKGSR